MSARPQNKGMKQTKPGPDGASQLIPSVMQTTDARGENEHGLIASAREATMQTSEPRPDLRKKGLPHWVRWILVLPAAVAGAGAIRAFLMVVDWLLPEGPDFIFAFIRSAAEPWTTILVGAAVAPRYRVIVAAVLATPLALLYGGGLAYLLIVRGFHKVGTTSVLNGIICFAACIGAVAHVCREFKDSDAPTRAA